MQERPDDLDASRSSATPADVAEASAALTEDLYRDIPFELLGSVKGLLKKFFSSESWDQEDQDALDGILSQTGKRRGWWTHELTSGLTLSHGFRDGRYHLWASGGDPVRSDPFDRVFEGPVKPEATPNPRHVRFVLGGTAAPGTWYRSDDNPGNRAVAELLADPDITDVLVAGDFVAIGLRRASMWEERLDEILEWVTELFWTPERTIAEADGPTRDELVSGRREGELHLLNPDDPHSREILKQAARSPDVRRRRMAVVTLAQSVDGDLAIETLNSGFSDVSRLVRRAVVDAAADIEGEQLRPLLEKALDDEDPWIRWKAIKGLEAIGVEESLNRIELLAEDDDFQVRFEVAAVMRSSR